MTHSVEELKVLLKSGLAHEQLSAFSHNGPILVDVASDSHRTFDLGHLPAVVLGIGEPGSAAAQACDAVLDADDPWLDLIISNGTRHPIAAASLAVLLRGSADRSISDGLAAESLLYSTLQSGPEFATWRAHRTPVVRAPEAGEPVLVVWQDNTLRLTLHRPSVHNAFSIAIRDALYDALTAARQDPSVTVILDGVGPSFCSGGFLDEFGTFTDPATAHIVRLTRSVGSLIAAMANRVHCELHGACLGAGIELPAFAGHVTAREGTTFGLPEIGLGLVPGAGGTVSLPRRIGRQRTALLALSGQRITTPTALEWGLIDAVV